MMNKLLVFLVAAFTLSCSSNNHSKESEGYTLKGDTIIIGSNDNLLSNLEISTVNPKPSSTKLSISGIVRAIPNNYAQVASSFIYCPRTMLF
jgi:cobalt-zinc-cadmium efflux system membrane fusion protein